MYASKAYDIRTTLSGVSSGPVIVVTIAREYAGRFVKNVHELAPQYEKEIVRADPHFPSFVLTDVTGGFGACARVAWTGGFEMTFTLTRDTASAVCQTLRLVFDILEALLRVENKGGIPQPVELSLSCLPGEYAMDGKLSGAFRGCFAGERVGHVPAHMAGVWRLLCADERLEWRYGDCALRVDKANERLTLVCPGIGEPATLMVGTERSSGYPISTRGVTTPAQQLTLLFGLVEALMMTEGSV